MTETILFLHFKSKPACARTICAPTLLKYGNEMEKESSDIARTYDVALAAARFDTTDPEVTSDGFYMDLMMTRGSDPLESKSTLGADRVAGRHAVIAAEEERTVKDRKVSEKVLMQHVPEKKGYRIVVYLCEIKNHK